MLKRIPFKGSSILKNTTDPSLKPIILTREQLKLYARQLAHVHEIGSTDNHLYRSILSNLRTNERSLTRIHKAFSEGLTKDKLLLPSSTEWLLDNYYVINEQIQAVKHDLTRGFYRDLAKLKSGALKGYPRIYSIALELLSHTDNRMDVDILTEFVLSYESVSPLTSAELWALPIMLRVVWIENLKHLMEKAFETYEKRLEASNLGDKLGTTRIYEMKDQNIGKLFYNIPNPDAIFLIWFMRNLRDKDHVAPLIHWLEQYIEQEDINIEEVIKAENHRQAANRVSTGNIITSMRLVSSIDWAVFFESVSLVERILEQDPAQVYSQMDFVSRDRYRHVVEKLSRFSLYNEQEVARRAIKLAAISEGKRRHVGYYLINNALPDLKKSLGYRPQGKTAVLDFVSQYPTFFYLFGIAVFTLIGLLLVSAATSAFTTPLWLLLAIVPLSVPAVSLVNKLVTIFFPPTTPPKLELKDGIPDDLRTVVIVPCLVGGSEELRNLVSALERRYLANKDKNLFFALLSDFPDAAHEHLPHEESLLVEMKHEIEVLNKKHEREVEPVFYLFHRKRMYNSHEKIWMGWERKRGKIEHFNRFLRENDSSPYELIVGNTEHLHQIKYVITLDSDTQMPLNTARKLIGAIAHPLNQAEIDTKSKTVTSGYGIIQPRVELHAPSAARSRFTRIFTSDSGLDPYHSVVSNVYQDFFNNAVYIGKGIYDVDVFHQCLKNTFPENRLLSHDLIEGCFVRVALASDIILLEDFPASYEGYSRRQHRWIRGDWQIAAWLFSPVLALQEKWKIFDNLRRSFVAPLGLAMVVSTWFLAPNIASGLTLLTVALVFFPIIDVFFSGLFSEFDIKDWRAQLIHLKRLFISISLWAYEALRNIDAAFRAIVRVTFKLRGTLEWTSHAAVERSKNNVSIMYPAIVLCVGLFIGSISVTQSVSTMPILLTVLWILSPFVAYLVSKPEIKEVQELTTVEKHKLMLTARRIWRFFDEYVNESNNFLPPDNIQISPGPIVAQKTSPTNIGLGLLSMVSAYDLGFISEDELCARIGLTLNTLERLEKHNGHFLNWYQTDTLVPLYPSYVSTVDSGNLAASLIVLKQTCLDFAQGIHTDILRDDVLKVTLRALREDWSRLAKGSANTIPVSKDPPKAEEHLKNIIKKVIAKIDRTNTSYPKGMQVLLHELSMDEEDAMKIIGTDAVNSVSYWRQSLEKLLDSKHSARISSSNWQVLAQRAMKMVVNMQFEFLFDEERKVFSIGFNINENKRDDSYYNLLATEARIASFIAIGLGQISDQHWFHLGRPLAKIHGKTALLSWGGTMFEYLMPDLFMKNLDNTLLSQSNNMIVERQIEYAHSKSIPWGISESGFFAFDYQYNYQYQQFGIPDLSLKAELLENLVVAPYATLLALHIKPLDAYKNLEVLETLGLNGVYGFYEAIDFTRVRMPKGEESGIVRSYMSHHQGMGLVALNNYFNSEVIRNRFHTDPVVIGADLLLAERIPMHIPKIEMQEVPVIRENSTTLDFQPSVSGRTDTVRATILSNSEYSVVVTNTGTGLSSWKDLDITRTSVDTTDTNWGWFCFVKDLNSSEVWSTTYQPYLKKPDRYSAQFWPHKAEFNRVDNNLEVQTSVVVSMDNNVEVRQLTLINKSKKVKKVELTDYAEVVGLKHQTDVSHPAFGKLFIESEYDAERQSLLFKRRKRNPEEEELWIWHMVRGNGEKVSVSEYETDRAAFLGRGNTILTARAFDEPLTKTVGATLDPVMSLRTKVILKPNEMIKLYYMTGVAESKVHAESLMDKFADPGEVERTFSLSEIHSQIELRHLGITSDEAKLFQKLGSKIIYPDRHYRAPKDILIQNTKGQSGLYPYGISGDYPIVVAKIQDAIGLGLIKQVLLAHELLRMKRVFFDLIILNEQATTYSGDLRESIQSLIDTSLSRPLVDKPGGIFIRESVHLTFADKILFDTAARVILDSQWGNLEDIFELVPKGVHKQNVYELARESARPKALKGVLQEENFAHNKWGSFNKAGNEYVITTQDDLPPQPWSNVIANPSFGTLVTSGGLGYTWAENSQLNRITTWSNDPTTEKPGEVLYLKEGANWWSSTPLPAGRNNQYTVTHGWGYTSYECRKRDIDSNTKVWVDPDQPIKFILLTLKNKSARDRVINPVFYAEVVLGDNREKSQFFIVTKRDEETKAITAHNTYNDTFASHITFVQSNIETKFTTDRSEFLGRGGSWKNPLFMNEPERELSGSIGAGVDPSIVMQAEVTVKPGEEKQVVFMIGQTKNHEEYLHLATHYKKLSEVTKSLERSVERFNTRLTKIQINTPDNYLNVLANGWLGYQVLSGRVWGRSSFYQSGGAFGFRDQLQDVLALVHSEPHLVREHILYSAEHQFIQGDVMHWWHPQTTRGVRTRMTDDFLWLPYAVNQYLSVTKDTQILDEKVSFMDMAALAEGERERYDEASVTKEKASLYTHCIRALENGMKTGTHGLPLIGGGDWNDGLNLVGIENKGESVWLAWFQFEVYTAFSKICKEQGDKHNALRYSRYAKHIAAAAEKHGWDGQWYKRAYFDNGSPLGSHENIEATIDSISQTWAVISGGAQEDRQEQALASVEKHLVLEDDQIILLLTPPFNNSNPFPGYIAGYLPGIRENGAQYTHAAAWLPLAYAKVGNGDRAVQLLHMLNPISHTDSNEKAIKYKGEPYVLAGDVYSHPQHIGRVGWSWYTGSASWVYRTIIENVIGLTFSGNELSFNPCVPKGWSEFSANYKWKETEYEINFINPNGVSRGVTSVSIDKTIKKNNTIRLVNDRKQHVIEVVMGEVST